jgi:hypothetical protein
MAPGTNLVGQDGMAVPIQQLKDKFVALYFSASWYVHACKFVHLCLSAYVNVSCSKIQWNHIQDKVVARMQ